MMNGAAASSNFTLLRTPSQPVAPLNALDFTSCPSVALLRAPHDATLSL
jgi:hypothetical protein